VRGSARVQAPHPHSPGPVITSPQSIPASTRHREHKPYPSNLQGVPCAEVHGFRLPTLTPPAQSAPAPGQNPQAPGTVHTNHTRPTSKVCRARKCTGSDSPRSLARPSQHQPPVKTCKHQAPSTQTIPVQPPRCAVRGSARVQTPHGHSPGPVSTSPRSKPASTRHRPRKPYPSNLQGVPCAGVHGFRLPTATRPAQSAPATSQNPQAPGTVIMSWSPTRTLTHALPHPARLGNRSRESALRQLDPRGGGDGFTSLALEGRPSLGLLVVLEMLIDPLLFRVIQIAWLVGSLV